MIIDTEKCVFCKACILICPNQALKLKEYNDKIEITFQKNLCIKDCSKCLNSCPTNSIQLTKCRKRKYVIPYSKCDICNEFTNKPINNHNNICSKCKKKLNASNIFEYVKYVE